MFNANREPTKRDVHGNTIHNVQRDIARAFEVTLRKAQQSRNAGRAAAANAILGPSTLTVAELAAAQKSIFTNSSSRNGGVLAFGYFCS
jgi:hypothetical protein